MKLSLQITLFLLVNSFVLAGQHQLPDLSTIETVVIKSYWGDQSIIGLSTDNSSAYTLNAVYTDTSKKPINLDGQLQNYVSMYREGNKLFIECREPKGFESIDLTIKLPESLLVESQLIKGGDIFMDNLHQGVEINSLNGSVNLQRIGDYALVSAANGEIDIQFTKVDPSKPISLITMNGGVTVNLPEEVERDVRIISRKNGYVLSDFDLKTDKPIKNLNKVSYSKTPILSSAQINGGGGVLFLSTQNGPIKIGINR